jgi:circadian clock protein KaiB
MNKYVLKLYIAGHTPRSVRAVSNLHRISRNNSNFECEVIIIDVLEQPDLANQDKILATPTLIKVSPPPQRRIIGDLSDPQQVIFILDLPAK